MRRALSLVAVLTTACTASTRAGTETSIAKALISDEQEAALGAQIKEELERGSAEVPPIKYSTDPVVTSYVQGLVDKLTIHADKDRKSNWQVFVIDDPNTVNAFATPGAYIYVYSGLLAAADDEAEVVGVLAHEIGHVVGHHTARQMVNTLGLNTIASLLLGNDPSMLAQVAASVVGTGTLLAYSRADENEADQYAVHYAAAADYDPTGVARFFEKLNQSKGKTPAVLSWLSTHPAPADRVERVMKTVNILGFKGQGEVGAERLAPIKQRIGGAVNVSTR